MGGKGSGVPEDILYFKNINTGSWRNYHKAVVEIRLWSG